MSTKFDMVVLDRTVGEEAERVDLFSLDGKNYSIPDQVRANVGLKYLWMAKTEGDVVAGSYLLEAMLGSENFETLMDCDGLTPAQLDSIMKICRRVVLGETEVPTKSPAKKRA